MDKLHVGTMGWSYDFWVGKLYPENTASKDFLAEYSRHFSTVEVDNTFYRIPSVDTVENWKAQASEGFLFSAKFPRVITHIKMLQNCQREVDVFLERISHLRDKLGPLLIQLPYSFKPEHFNLLHDFLTNLPKSYRFAVEVRNKKMLEEKLYALLRENRAALAWVDHPFMPEINVTTSDFVYIRWEGDRRKVNGTLGRIEIDRTDRIKKWAEKMRKFLDASLEVFGYFSKYYSGYPPTDVNQLLGFLGYSREPSV
ncbi:MAG TPA: DUF72 domain-containing protein [Candidatus Krumholzibacteriaceae bacterium]|jgi:uncharacterized protein YecE (DUF72 family)|nr:DUF72 domain-containing protein [Candidatus Krumholzibacteriaceae bacterium]